VSQLYADMSQLHLQGSVDDYHKKACRLKNAFEAAGQSINDGVLVTAMLHGLPREFDILKANIMQAGLPSLADLLPKL
jgi:hypothetical protein